MTSQSESLLSTVDVAVMEELTRFITLIYIEFVRANDRGMASLTVPVSEVQSDRALVAGQIIKSFIQGANGKRDGAGIAILSRADLEELREFISLLYLEISVALLNGEREATLPYDTVHEGRALAAAWFFRKLACAAQRRVQKAA